MTGSDVATITFATSVSGDLLPGWSVWDMPCGCRMAASANGETLRVWCAAGESCDCAQCQAVRP